MYWRRFAGDRHSQFCIFKGKTSFCLTSQSSLVKTSKKLSIGIKALKFFVPLVLENQGEKYVIIKGSVPSSLKLQFKILCTQKELKMSEVLEKLIKQWIQADAPIANFAVEISEEDEDYEDVKGYIPNDLKIQFKIFCTQKKVKMRFVLYNLIHKWVKTGGVFDA